MQSTQPPPSIYTRQEHVQHLAQFIRGLLEAAQSTPAPEKTRAALLASMEGACIGCGIPLTGEELLSLGTVPSQGESAKVARLRMGYCARAACDSLFYTIRCHPHPELDWPKLLHLEQAVEEAHADEEKCAALKAKRLFRKRMFIRLGLGLALLVILLIVRQLYLGGRISFIREPENFRVDPDAVLPPK